MIKRKRGLYEKVLKRVLDIVLSLIAIIVLSWLFIIVSIVVRIRMGSPVLFKQPRPGMIDAKTGKETIFNMYKFRTMTDERDSNGELLPDEKRLTQFGKLLRATSLDELPEVFNIFIGDMSVIGPRPQLVRDLVFMSDEQRLRHTAKPGLSGLAQINGRNAVTWDQKFEWDLKYIEDVNFIDDCRIMLLTAKKVFGKDESPNEIELADDFGDALLKAGRISKEEYDAKQAKAKIMLAEHEKSI